MKILRNKDAIKWATENPEAMMCLIEGKAAVVPTERKSELPYLNDSYVYFISTIRLDKPKEAV